MRLGTDERKMLDAICKREGPLAVLEEVVRYWEVLHMVAAAKDDMAAARHLYAEAALVRVAARKIAACRKARVLP